MSGELPILNVADGRSVATAKAKILLVEDNANNADMLIRRLTRLGIHVVLATDGAQAVAQAHQEHPDLILMDLSLPEVDGLEATRRIKQDPATSAIPVVALTAHAMDSDRELSMAAGCDGFETKPVNFRRLTATIQSLLGQRTQHG